MQADESKIVVGEVGLGRIEDPKLIVTRHCPVLLRVKFGFPNLQFLSLAHLRITWGLFGGNGRLADRSVPPYKVTPLKGKGTVTLNGGTEWSTRLSFPLNRLLDRKKR